MPDDPMTKPRDTSLASEHIPAEEHPLAKKNFAGEEEEQDDARTLKRPAQAVRQDAGLGDTSTRDETRR